MKSQRKNEDDDFAIKNIAFDTLQFSKRAELAGFTKQQADFQAEELASMINTEIATKSDLRILQKKMESYILKMIISFGGMLTAAVVILAAIIKLN